MAVATAGSFRRAALCLPLGQSAVSRRIQKLEDSLGVSLFERSASGTRLTAAGKSFVDRAHVAMDELESAAKIARAAGCGHFGALNIGVCGTMLCEPVHRLLLEYRTLHPEVALVFSEYERSELLISTSHRRIDALICVGIFKQAYGDSIILAKEQLQIIVPVNHALAEGERISWSDVEGASFIVGSGELHRQTHSHLARELAMRGIHPDVAHHRVGFDGIVGLVCLGFGFGLGFSGLAMSFGRRVSWKPIGNSADSLPISILWRPENDNPALRRFVSLARVHAKRNGAPS